MTMNDSSGHVRLSSTGSTRAASAAAMSTSSPWGFDTKKRNRMLKRYRTQVASATSTICATLAVTPLENLKTRMQTHNFRNLKECAKYIWRTEGFRGYTAGFLPPLMSVTFVRVISFSTYQAVKYRISDEYERLTGVSPLLYYNQPGSVPSFATITTFTVAGMCAGLAASPFACPFELAKNVVQTSVLMAYRSQASPDAVRDPRVRSLPRLGTIQAFRKIISRHGFRGLYTGYYLHAIRDTIGTGLYFGIYETVKQIIAKEMGKPAQTPFGPPMVAGALCGTIPWLVTYSLDTRKTRAQSILLGRTKEIGEASVAVSRSSMYKGLSVSLMRTSFQNMILFSLFEYTKAQINSLET
ncbi:hypothetical protein TMatcc_003788 [Talaromyces marneffei ATCC 18224]|uniref:Mitochondrial carrier protein, putative n=2 Tax=Talaromyces marneffei TaxID=37727 RepID=B6Q230_TALMQ|nr:mitochondrial carrier protein, putative [Talaromyces marneffei ATCC 18224]KAE8556424.1 hypothetical protein EYB25_001125 [Talaromyces marneffei]